METRKAPNSEKNDKVFESAGDKIKGTVLPAAVMRLGAGHRDVGAVLDMPK
jgi:hypothetical protein